MSVIFHNVSYANDETAENCGIAGLTVNKWDKSR